MRIALVNPKGPEGMLASMPHGLMQLSAELRARGHEAPIIDYCLDGGPTDISCLADYDLVGLSAMSTQLPHAIQIAETLDRPGGPKVAWGGVHVTLDPQSVLTRFPKHFVIRGEGEHPLCDLVDHLDGKHDRDWLRFRPGLCLREKDEFIVSQPTFTPDLEALADVDYFQLDRLPAYLRSYDYFFDEYVDRIQVLVARGCHWTCTFCINPIYMKQGGKYRAKSIAKIRREAEPVIDAFNLRFAEPRDEDFFIKRDLLDSWSEFTREKKLLWVANCRFNYFRDNLLTTEKVKDLCDSGLYAVGMSIETGDETIRNTVIKKAIKDENIDRAVETLDTAVGRKIAIATSFIAYFPGDTAESRRKIVRMMARLSKEANTVFSGPQIYRSYPGSPLYSKEDHQYAGDLEYYLKNVIGGGVFAGVAKEIADRHDAFFYSYMLPNYYNMFFRPYHETSRPADEAPATWEAGSSAPIRDRALYLSMGIIRLRERLDWWECFIDPMVLPTVYRLIGRIIGLPTSITGLAQRQLSFFRQCFVALRSLAARRVPLGVKRLLRRAVRH